MRPFRVRDSHWGSSSRQYSTDAPVLRESSADPVVALVPRVLRRVYVCTLLLRSLLVEVRVRWLLVSRTGVARAGREAIATALGTRWNVT